MKCLALGLLVIGSLSALQQTPPLGTVEGEVRRPEILLSYVISRGKQILEF
jgi:hypothetical protein